jgi:hypothetical protein
VDQAQRRVDGFAARVREPVGERRDDPGVVLRDRLGELDEAGDPKRRAQASQASSSLIAAAESASWKTTRSSFKR